MSAWAGEWVGWEVVGGVGGGVRGGGGLRNSPEERETEPEWRSGSEGLLSLFMS